MPKPLKLLVVEDVSEDALLMNRALTRHGFQVTGECVHSLDELTRALQNNPDIVLADYKVPNLVLESVLSAVQLHPLRPPVIVVSGAVGEETAAATIRLGAADYVMKDHLTRLGPAVERALEDAQHRRRERELEAELRLRNMAFASISDGVAITDPGAAGHPIVDCNPAFERITGYRRDEVLGRNLHFLEGTGPGPTMIPTGQQSFDDGQPFRGELRHFRKDGTPFWNEMMIQPLRDADGNVLRFVAVLRDITEQRDAEQKAAQRLAALTHFDRLKTAAEMATGLAHELNQPLAAIVLQSETATALAAGLTGPSHGKFLAVVETIGAQAIRAAEIIRLLRRLVKKSAASRSTVSLSQIVRDSLKIMEHDIDKAGVDVVFHGGPVLPMILGDTIQLQQVIINLLRNAIEAMSGMPQENRRIEIHCDEAVIADAPGVALSISDNGPGIDPADFPRIFESFHTTKPQGIGMGLAICRSIIQSHEGTIECGPNPDAGVTFTLVIPVQRMT